MSVRRFAPLFAVSLFALFTTCDQSPLPVAPDSPGIVAARGGKTAQDQIVFMSGRVAGQAEVFLINADGSGLKNLSQDPAYDGFPEWSPDGKSIAFASVRDGVSEVYVMRSNGSRQTRLTFGHGDRPRWSPDGTRIAFFSYQMDGNHEIYVMNADGSGQTRLTNNTVRDIDPRWSPDGTKIAFESERDGNKEVYVMNAAGSGQTNLTNHSADDLAPRWSPDGTKIAFESERDGNKEVYVMNADGTGQKTNLTKNAAIDQDAWWSPDGTKIAFESWRAGDAEVYVMNADGSGPTNLTTNAATDRAPQWSPDGTKISFVSFRDSGNREIYVMNADGSDQTNITNHPSTDADARWKPLPCAKPPCEDDSGGGKTAKVEETNLGDLLGPLGSRATDIDGLGQVVGYYKVQQGAQTRTQAFLLTRREEKIDIGVGLGFDDTQARGMNENTEVVGTAIASSPFRQPAFIWDEKQGFRELSSNLSGFDTFLANDVSAGGVIVGQAFSQTTKETRAVVWLSETADPLDLGLGAMFAISENGMAVGWDKVAARATIWTAADGESYLPAPPEQSGTSRAYDINDNGDAVGFVEISTSCSPSPECKRRTAIWRADGSITLLGPLSANGIGGSVALGVNEKLEVVGWADTGNGWRAFFWSEKLGMIDLQTEGGIGEAVNARRQIAGQASFGGVGLDAALWIVR